MTGRLPSIARLADTGPVRSAAALAIRSELQMSLGVCPDRGAPIANRLLDRVVEATRTVQPTGRPRP
jgi:hypothetical protein